MCAEGYASALLGKSKRTAAKRLGTHDAEIAIGSTKVGRLWKMTRVLAVQAGLFYPPAKDEPLRFYAITEATARVSDLAAIETTRPRVQTILGEPDALWIRLDRELPVWTQNSINSAVLLISESPDQFRRKLPFRHRISAKAQRRAERMKAFRFERRDNKPRWHGPQDGIKPTARIVQARHRWAENPRAITETGLA